MRRLLCLFLLAATVQTGAVSVPVIIGFGPAGMFAALELIRRLLVDEQGANHVLGYWIAQSPKMAYKNTFRPLEIFRDGRWQQAEAPNKL